MLEVGSCVSRVSLRPCVESSAHPLPPTDLVLIHGSVVHRSEKNLSPKSRFIYTVSSPFPYSLIRLRKGPTFDPCLFPPALVPSST